MDLRNPKVLKLKGILFLILGLGALVLLFLQVPSWTNLALFAICIWAFCRFYYFAFYVLQHYVDPAYRYSGILDMVRYLVAGRSREQEPADSER